MHQTIEQITSEILEDMTQTIVHQENLATEITIQVEAM